MMRIAFDAKWYFKGPPSGKVVVRNLINNLPKSERDNVLLIFRKRDRENVSASEQLDDFKKIFIPSIFSLVDNTLIMPIYLLGKNISVVFCQNFVPLFGSFKKVAHIHDLLFLEFPQFYSMTERLYFIPLRLTRWLASGILTVSQTEKERISKFYRIDRKKIHVIYHGVDETFKPKEETELNEKFALFVGRLNIRKNIDLLVSLWKENEFDLPLKIVGSYDWKTNKYDFEELEKHDIYYLGHKDHTEIVEILQKSKLFLFPSLAESFGLPIVEAMKCGIPVICFDNTCIPEIAGEGYQLVPNLNKEKFKERIVELSSNHDLWQTSSTHGVKNARRFLWKNSSEELLTYLLSFVKPL